MAGDRLKRTPHRSFTELMPEAYPLEALRRYFDYAQRNLAAGAGNEIAGSVALQFLGKLHVVMADQPVEPVVAAEPKAMASSSRPP